MFTFNTVFMHEIIFKEKLLKSCDAIANCTKQHDAVIKKTVKVHEHYLLVKSVNMDHFNNYFYNI